MEPVERMAMSDRSDLVKELRNVADALERVVGLADKPFSDDADLLRRAAAEIERLERERYTLDQYTAALKEAERAAAEIERLGLKLNKAEMDLGYMDEVLKRDIGRIAKERDALRAALRECAAERDDLRSFSDEQADAIAARIKERDALRAVLREIRDEPKGTWHGESYDKCVPSKEYYRSVIEWCQDRAVNPEFTKVVPNDTDKLAALLVEYAGGSEGRLDAHHFPLLARWLTERGVGVRDEHGHFCETVELVAALEILQEELDHKADVLDRVRAALT
jgi:hypothetical protein